jgi:DNA helicase HerA-like ATPase
LKIKTDQLITICGKRGAGKTELAKKILHSISPHRIEIFDINGEYNEAGFKAYIPDTPLDFEAWCGRVYSAGNKFVGVDEADMVFPEKGKLEGYSYKIIHLGRHRNIGGVFLTRRLARLNKDVFSQSDHVFIYKLFIPNDIDYLEEFIGEKAENVRYLKPYWFYYFNSDTSEFTLHKPIIIG